jgi:acyl-CoA synthetase (AMP-forming)/AMP-acid ligase II
MHWRPDLLTFICQAFGAPVIEAYAMTEAAHQMTSNPLPEDGQRKVCNWFGWGLGRMMGRLLLPRLNVFGHMRVEMELFRNVHEGEQIRKCLSPTNEYKG